MRWATLGMATILVATVCAVLGLLAVRTDRSGARDQRLPIDPHGILTATPTLEGDSAAGVPVAGLAAAVERRAQLRIAPGGRVVGTIGRLTRFHGRQVLAVVSRRPGWLGVLHPSFARGRHPVWIPVDAART